MDVHIVCRVDVQLQPTRDVTRLVHWRTVPPTLSHDRQIPQTRRRNESVSYHRGLIATAWFNTVV